MVHFEGDIEFVKLSAQSFESLFSRALLEHEIGETRFLPLDQSE
ncbi:MAG: hypothetical protein SGI90_04700 [Candidatus Eisenbacteria bacterium]|nr:hypothetical protein [Candidatus Eisenbacteria bacterium]